jgi:uncharacterized membrane protein
MLTSGDIPTIAQSAEWCARCGKVRAEHLRSQGGFWAEKSESACLEFTPPEIPKARSANDAPTPDDDDMRSYSGDDDSPALEWDTDNDSAEDD